MQNLVKNHTSIKLQTFNIPILSVFIHTYINSHLFPIGLGRNYSPPPITILTYSSLLVLIHTSGHTRTPFASTTQLSEEPFILNQFICSQPNHQAFQKCVASPWCPVLPPEAWSCTSSARTSSRRHASCSASVRTDARIGKRRWLLTRSSYNRYIHIDTASLHHSTASRYLDLSGPLFIDFVQLGNHIF